MREWGGEPKRYPIVPDDYERLKAAVREAAETHDLAGEARRKLAAKRLDLIVANDVTAPGAGFGGDTNVVRLIDAAGLDETLPVLPKEDVAGRILDWVAARRAAARPRPARAPAAQRRSPRSSGRGA